ncbi:DUF1850 domain-containing protein [Jeotgalibacillus campisalis]|uniref:RocC n=1 Tax=Jeotgalibacillus campisalis TaxID=220754 RepID=A0A0C2S050_9BACL|nr:DUF1850 domain-containing protein [Jeotgalibacillus campisalis]KIL47444.1 hypothetical protein KR50_16110 [Jeotgalibacillus campisalis]
MAAEKKTVKQKILWLIFCLALILFLLIAIFIPVKKALTFQDLRSREILAYLPIKEDQTFQLEYTHSIHQSTVIDTYTVLPDHQIQQTELQYEDMAIGMPSNAMFDGEIFVEKDGKYFIKNMNRVFPSINLRTSQVVISHKIKTEGSTYKMHDFIAPGSLINLEVKDLTMFQLLRGVKMNG